MWGGGLTGLGQLMSVGAGLGKAYQDYQAQQEKQRRDQLILEEFRQRQADEKRKNDTMAALGQVYGRLPMAQSPQAGPGAAAMSPPDAMPATSPPPQMASAPPPSFGGSAGGGGMAAGGSVGRDTGYGGIPTVGPNARFPALPPNTTNDPGTPGPGYTTNPVDPSANTGSRFHPENTRPVSGPNDNAVAQLNAGKPTQIADASGSGGFMTQMAQQGGNPQKAQGAALAAYPRIPQQFRGSLQGPDLAKIVDDVMGPGADPATKGMVIQHLIGFADKQTQQEFEQWKFGIQQGEKRDEFKERQEDRRLQRQQMQEYHRESLDLRREQQDRGGTVLQPEGGAPLWVDRSGQARPIKDESGQPLTAPLSKPGGGGGPRSVPAMVMQQYRKENPHATADDLMRFQARYARSQSIARAFGGGERGRNLDTLNTVADHVVLLREYAEALNNNEIPRANQVLNRLATETGKPQVKDFNTVKTVMADEFVRLMTSTGGTESDRKNMNDLFEALGAPEQLAGTINAATRLISGRLKALEQHYAGNDPASREEFQNELLTDTARQVFSAQMPAASAPQGTPANPGGGGSTGTRPPIEDFFR